MSKMMAAVIDTVSSNLLSAVGTTRPTKKVLALAW